MEVALLRCQHVERSIALRHPPGQFAFPVPVYLSGEFLLRVLQTLGSAGLGGIIGGWLRAKHGRRVWLKVGDIEAAAQTVEELERLLKLAEEIQQRNQPKVIREP